MSSIDLPFWIYSSLRSKKEYVDKYLKISSIKEIIENNKKIIIEEYSNSNNLKELTLYKYKQKIHRENDQPAIIWEHGDQEWFIEGQRNRINDQPAVIQKELGRIWFVNNSISRENFQPSFINFNNNEFYIQGNKEFSLSEIQQLKTKKNINKF